jgi:hypothetical protein
MRRSRGKRPVTGGLREATVAEIWPVNLTPADRTEVVALAQRRSMLGLNSSYAQTIREAVRLAATASDDDLRKGEL